MLLELFSLVCLCFTVYVIAKMNPRYCSRCSHGTNFPMYQHLQKNPNWPLQRYCLKCFFWINLSVWKCDSCKATGTHRIHEEGFFSRFLIIKQRKNVYKICQCGNKIELQQQC